MRNLKIKSAMSKKESAEFLSGQSEVELTDVLIETLVRERKWGDVESLKEMRAMGGRWNAKRNSVVFPAEPI